MTLQAGNGSDVQVTCRRCGRSGSEQACLHGWSRQTGGRGELWLCESCTREAIRGIEAGFDDLS